MGDGDRTRTVFPPADFKSATSASSITPTYWYGQWDLNPYTFRHGNLNPACLPIPSCPHIEKATYPTHEAKQSTLFSVLLCSFQQLWRSEWDLNPRKTQCFAGFQDRFHQPLGHRCTLTQFETLFNFHCWPLELAKFPLRSPATTGIKAVL